MTMLLLQLYSRVYRILRWRAMSAHETAMTRWYWQQVKGTLIEEFVAVQGTLTCGRRVLDGVIIKGREFWIAQQCEVSLEGKDIIVIQTKASRLDMSLMGQTFFSAPFMQRFKPLSVVSVALCSQDDAVLRPLLEQYPNMHVVVCPLSRIDEDGHSTDAAHPAAHS
jgi:hypothetical protein